MKESKQDYVFRQTQKPQAADHHCHWPNCGKSVPPALWGCKKHWFMLPKYLRDAIWATYNPGQEITKTPSEAYIEVAKQVQNWIVLYEADCEARKNKTGKLF